MIALYIGTSKVDDCSLKMTGPPPLERAFFVLLLRCNEDFFNGMGGEPPFAAWAHSQEK
ncbi:MULTISPECIES: hypothetical protein [unclassified Mameliella]|uniref:hypothetical protein n=1 Tax=unclassified Mameliella TaxID=2630630 RepID=UPI00273F72D6|nr:MULTISPECIES: hypothetical protein [unclassified Mameliella]